MQVNNIVKLFFPYRFDGLGKIFVKIMKLVNIRIGNGNSPELLFGKKMQFYSWHLLFQAAYGWCC